MPDRESADPGREQPLAPPRSAPICDMQKYRCLVGHLICESLGYFTPRSALRAVLAHRDGGPYACEWYSHMAMCRGNDMFDRATLLDVNRSTLERAFRNRHGHTGFMAHYPRAQALVQREIAADGSTSSMLASWF